jgi:hypothetical protein
MVDYVKDPNELVRKLRAYAFAGDIDDDKLRERLQTIPGVTADVLTEAAEILYAFYDKLNKEGKTILGELWTYGNEQHWTTFAGGDKGTDNRAEQIIDAVRHDIGELKSKGPKPDKLPEPQKNRRDNFDWRYPDGVPPAAVEASPVPPPGTPPEPAKDSLPEDKS